MRHTFDFTRNHKFFKLTINHNCSTLLTQSLKHVLFFLSRQPFFFWFTIKPFQMIKPVTGLLQCLFPFSRLFPFFLFLQLSFFSPFFPFFLTQEFFSFVFRHWFLGLGDFLIRLGTLRGNFKTTHKVGVFGFSARILAFVILGASGNWLIFDILLHYGKDLCNTNLIFFMLSHFFITTVLLSYYPNKDIASTILKLMNLFSSHTTKPLTCLTRQSHETIILTCRHHDPTFRKPSTNEILKALTGVESVKRLT